MSVALKSSGLVLAGGQSRRMGVDKATLVFDGETLLQRAVRVLSAVTDEVVVIGLGTSALDAPIRYLSDEKPNVGPIGGIATGLRAATYDWVLVVGCDMPFLNRDVLRYLLSVATEVVVRPSSAASVQQAVVPLLNGRAQPLQAAYHRDILPVVERQIAEGHLRLLDLLEQLEVRRIPEDALRPIDPDLHSFVNVNTMDEFKAALRL